MILKNPVNNPKRSTWIISLMMLLSFMVFSVSVSANVDSRKSADRETIANRNLSAKKRSTSLQQARLFLTLLEFFRNADQVSQLYSVPQHTQVLQTILRIYNTKKTWPSEIHQALHVHAPRSADVIA
jgi:5-bromo-4-chloroindolyl phosphate hydrolysis protein